MKINYIIYNLLFIQIIISAIVINVLFFGRSLASYELTK